MKNKEQETNVSFVTYKNIEKRLNRIFENNNDAMDRERLVLNEFNEELKDKYVGEYIVDKFLQMNE